MKEKDNGGFVGTVGHELIIANVTFAPEIVAATRTLFASLRVYEERSGQDLLSLFLARHPFLASPINLPNLALSLWLPTVL